MAVRAEQTHGDCAETVARLMAFQQMLQKLELNGNLAFPGEGRDERAAMLDTMKVAEAVLALRDIRSALEECEHLLSETLNAQASALGAMRGASVGELLKSAHEAALSVLRSSTSPVGSVRREERIRSVLGGAKEASRLPEFGEAYVAGGAGKSGDLPHARVTSVLRELEERESGE